MHEIKEYYPEMGSDASIIIGKINYTQDMPKLILLAEKIKNSSTVLHQIDAWPLDFKTFIEVHYHNKGM